MTISHTAHVTLNEPCDQIDLEAWLFGLSDADYQACANGHRGAGVFSDEQGRGMINVESIGGNLIVQHYRAVHADRGSVEMYSPASRVPVLGVPGRLSLLGRFLASHVEEEARGFAADIARKA